MSEASDNSAIINDFLLESFEALGSIVDEITMLEKNPKDEELINSIYRTIHTIKGSAGFLGFTKLQAVAHSVENILSLIRENTISLNSELVDIFYESFDLCSNVLKNIEANNVEGELDSDGFKLKLLSVVEKSILHNEQIINDELYMDELRMKSSEQIIREAAINNDIKKVDIKSIENETIKNENKTDSKKVQVMKEDKKESPTKKAEKKPAKAAKKSVSDSVVKVNVSLLDDIMNVVGELVLNRNQIMQLSAQKDDSEFSTLAVQLDAITSELQNGIMEMRMQPVGSVFSKFERTIRDLARSQNKPIQLIIEGKETELDKTLLEAIKDPMTHMIRNSVDHGIEKPEARKASGKMEEGHITIKAYHEGGQVIIEVKDDGGGIDPKIIANKAIEKGVVTEEELATWSDKQIINLVFNAGFSTAEAVTNISGRGVGMDVVRSNIEKIGGEVDLTSVVGEGSVFKLKIPLTLAIVPALIVQSRQEQFAIHQKNLVELVLLENLSEKESLEMIDDQEFFRLRGNLIPLFRIDTIFKLEGERIKNSEFDDGDSLNVVVMQAEGNTYGLIVDRVLDTQEIVVKPLSKKLKDLSFYAGSTIMGDGKVALIIDAFGFYNFIEGGNAKKQDTSKKEETQSDNYKNAEEQEYLVVRLGDERGYAIPLCLVTRLEEFAEKDINFSGELALIKYGEKPMPLLNVEKLLQMDATKSRLNNLDKNPIIPTIVFSVKGHNVSLVVDEILDIGVTTSEVNTDSVDRDGLWGTVYINDNLYPVIDIHRLVEMHPIGKNIFAGKKKVKLNKTILLAEDSPVFQKVLIELLEEEGFDVLLGKNGAEAYKILETTTTKIDLIVTDVEMPELNGFQFAKKVRENEKFSTLPIVAVTTRVDEKDLQKGKEVGFTCHLEKLNKEDVTSHIKELV